MGSAGVVASVADAFGACLMEASLKRGLRSVAPRLTARGEDEPRCRLGGFFMLVCASPFSSGL